MKLFGYETTAQFPYVRAMSNVDPSLVVPPIGTDKVLDARAINADPMGDWYLALPSKLPPKEVESILRMALAGNPWQQYQLVQRMRDSWPMFKKCEMELRSVVASCSFVVQPYAEPGEEPTESAKEKADLVRRTIEGFRPDRFAEEEGWYGFIYDLTEAILNGVSITELIWDEDARDAKGNREKRIRATAFVHPRHYSWRADGTVGIAPSETTNWLAFPSKREYSKIYNNPSKFIVAKAKNKSGTPLGAGIARVLAPMWVQVVYGRDFMLNFAQKYGNPFMHIAYQSGISENEVATFQRMAQRAANQGWLVTPDSGKVDIHPAQGMNGNAQVELLKIADEACQLVFLGQTLTSSVSKEGGSRAQATVHADVKTERVESILKWVSETLTEQLVESLLQENYGDVTERPRIVPDMTRPLDALEQAQFLAALSNCTVPLPVADTYKKLGITVPAEGDVVLVQGKIGSLGATDTEIEANPQQPAPLQGDGDELGEEQPESQEPSQDKQDDFTSARFSGTNLRTLLAKLPHEELAEVKNLIVAAKQAPHANGELTALNKKLFELAGGRK